MADNLFAERTSFIGRQADLRVLADTLRDGARLVTVTGAAGIGKTRLVREHARRLHEPGATWFVDLRDARTVPDVQGATARALGVLVDGGDERALEDQLGRALAARGRCLLVLDNFEQLVATSADMVGRWLDAASEAHILVTSRERLRIAGEHVIDLDPLLHEEAMTLFLSRARAVRADFGRKGAAAAEIAELVTALDNLPLAIELCAARVDLAEPVELLRGLSRRFELLSRGPRDVAARQATLRGALDWSWDLLCEWERDALAQSSVFRAGFDREAADAVLRVQAPAGCEPMQSLVDKSLVDVFTEPQTGTRRYRLFESVREYAVARLHERPSCEGTAERHADHYLNLASSLSPARTERLAVEFDNLRAVHQHASQRGRRDVAFRALLAMGSLLPRLGAAVVPLSRLLEDELSRADGIDVETHGAALILYGRALNLCGRRGAAAEALERALDYTSRVDAVARAGSMSAGLYARMGRHADADRCIVRAERALQDRATMDPNTAAYSLLYVGMFHRARGDDTANRAAQQDAVALFTQSGDRLGEGYARANLSLCLIEEGKWSLAQEQLEHAVVAARESSHPRAEVHAAAKRQLLEHARGDCDAAAAELVRALHLVRQTGDRFMEAYLLQGVAAVELERGLPNAALAAARSSLALVAGAGSARLSVPALLLEACALARSGALEDSGKSYLRATALIAGASPVEERRLVALATGALALESARTAASRLDLRTAFSHLELARASARELLFPRDAWAARALAGWLDHLVDGDPAFSTASDALVVNDAGRWFSLPGGARVDLARRDAIANVLRVLAEARVRRPGEALSAEELIAAGWPGEKMSEASAKSRLRMAVMTLRKLGLVACLQHEAAGYLLATGTKLRTSSIP